MVAAFEAAVPLPGLSFRGVAFVSAVRSYGLAVPTVALRSELLMSLFKPYATSVTRASLSLLPPPKTPILNALAAKQGPDRVPDLVRPSLSPIPGPGPYVLSAAEWQLQHTARNRSRCTRIGALNGHVFALRTEADGIIVTDAGPGPLWRKVGFEPKERGIGVGGWGRP